ncbi:putative RNA-directed DNA polymerase from transposon X-element [Trichonephila clavipes]|nr:putative RNA-directed DNA polymerase from transposon X-element [Trichonephila clavipes]
MTHAGGSKNLRSVAHDRSNDGFVEQNFVPDRKFAPSGDKPFKHGMNSERFFCASVRYDTQNSDHYPVILEINLNTSIIKNPEHLSTNWYNFKFALNKKPLPTVELTSNDNIELAISELNQNFTEAFVEASKPKFNNAPKILSPEIKFKIYQRNRLRKFWQRTRCPSIYSQFRTLSREIAKDIQAYSRVQWEKHIEALSPVDNTLWRKSSLLRKPFQSIPPLKGALGSIAITPIEKAEVIADSLQVQFEPNHVAGRELFDQRIHDEVTNFINTPRSRN